MTGKIRPEFACPDEALPIEGHAFPTNRSRR